MEARLLPGKIHRETEFVGGLHGACGPNAASMAERWADQSALGTLDVYRRMRAAGRCDPGGESTLRALADDARAAGYQVDTLAYREPMPEADWRAFFERHAGRRAIVFETAYGQALRDALSGRGENATNLHYHFVMVAGWHPGGITRVAQAAGRDLPAGWWCCDGDSFAGGDVMQLYPDAVMAASRPCAAMAITARVSIEGSEIMTTPQGWHDDGTTLTAPNGVPVVRGFRDVVLAGPWLAEDWPLAPEASLPSVEPGNPAIGPGSRQDFRLTSLGWTTQRGAYRIWVGQDVRALTSQLSELAARLAAVRQQLPAEATRALTAVQALSEALHAQAS
jgi:hypothetical protein